MKIVNGEFLFDDEVKETETVEEIKYEIKYDIWKIINNISSEKNLLKWDDIKKSYNMFLINRTLSAEAEFIPLVTKLNMMYNIPPEIHYRLLHKAIPKKKRFFKFLSDKKIDADMMLIMQTFGINYDEATYSVKKLSKENLKTIFKTIEEGMDNKAEKKTDKKKSKSK